MLTTWRPRGSGSSSTAARSPPTCAPTRSARTTSSKTLRATFSKHGSIHEGRVMTFALIDEPSCDVVVLEQDICGGGVSGRNAGWILPWAPKLPTLLKTCGDDEALRLYRASEAAVDEIRQLTEQHGIEIDFHRNGWLWVAS